MCAQKYRLEVCVDSPKSALIALEAGANRIELCSNLAEGGFTPTPGMLKAIKQNFKSNVEVFVMIRPQGRVDFEYDAYDIVAIETDIEVLKSHGADGFVFGALNGNEIDENLCRRVIELCHPLPVTFHRAFDHTDRHKCLSNAGLVQDMGFKRLLTSGFAMKAIDGLSYIKNINESMGELVVMPGAGVNPTNLLQILNDTGCREVHSSAKSPNAAPIEKTDGLHGAFGNSPTFADTSTVVQMVKLINELQLLNEPAV